MNHTDTKLGFEQKLEMLEALVSKMSEGGLSLEELLREYELGVKLSQELNIDLEKAQEMMMSMQGIRVGLGYDVHRLVEGRPLILCGVTVPFDKGLLGHSDADVACHALTDALFGACALGDIGSHFPDTDDRFKGADSIELLRESVNILKAAGYEPLQLDITIAAQQPKLAGFIPQMRENLAAALKLPLENISVKATTTEKLGFEGRGEGISAQAAATVGSVR